MFLLQNLNQVWQRFSLDKTVHSSQILFFFKLALHFSLARVVRNIRTEDLCNRWSSVEKNACKDLCLAGVKPKLILHILHFTELQILAKWDCVPSWPQTYINRTSHAEQAKTVLSLCWILHCLAFYLIIYTHAKQVNKMQWVSWVSLYRRFAQV